MEDYFDFQIDFDNISTAPHLFETSESPETIESQDSDLYEEIMQGTKKAYRCTYLNCGKVFKFKSEITRHIIIHQKDRPYHCSFRECKKSFKRLDALENHMRIHAGVQPYSCNFPNCDKRFVTKAALRYHQIRHDNNRVYKCDVAGCDKSFLTASQLKQHQKAYNIHTHCSRPYSVEEEPRKMVKDQPKIEEGYQESTTESDSNSNIQWEMRSQNCEDEDFNENAQEKFEAIFKYILNENKILKERLQDKQKKSVSLEKKQSFSEKCGERIQFLQSQEPSSFFDNNELRFLEFLRGKEEDLC